MFPVIEDTILAAPLARSETSHVHFADPVSSGSLYSHAQKPALANQMQPAENGCLPFAHLVPVESTSSEAASDPVQEEGILETPHTSKGQSTLFLGSRCGVDVHLAAKFCRRSLHKNQIKL